MNNLIGREKIEFGSFENFIKNFMFKIFPGYNFPSQNVQVNEK